MPEEIDEVSRFYDFLMTELRCSIKDDPLSVYSVGYQDGFTDAVSMIHTIYQKMRNGESPYDLHK